MMTTNLKRRHLQQFQREQVCEWIKSQPKKPTWLAVSEFILREFNIERKENTVCRDPTFIAAMKARAKVLPPAPSKGKPTTKKLLALIEENDKLKVRIAALEAQVAAYLQERIMFIKFASDRHITEAELRCDLYPVERNRTKVEDDKPKRKRRAARR